MHILFESPSRVSDCLIIFAILTLLWNNAIPPFFIRKNRVHRKFVGQTNWYQNLFKNQISTSCVKCILVFIKYLFIIKGYVKDSIGALAGWLSWLQCRLLHQKGLWFDN